MMKKAQAADAWPDACSLIQMQSRAEHRVGQGRLGRAERTGCTASTCSCICEAGQVERERERERRASPLTWTNPTVLASAQRFHDK